MRQTTRPAMQDPQPETPHRPVTPPEWTPPPGTAPPPPATPPRPERPPTLPMILMPEPGSDEVGAQLLRRRIVMVTGPLDHDTADAAAQKLLLLNEQSHDGITLHISCPDAELDAALTLVATIDMLSADTTAIAAGTVEGAAVAVYATATHRTSHPHATFVLRDARADLRGDAEQLRTAAEQHRRQVDTLHERIATATGQSKDTVAHDMEQGRLLTAEQALAYGLVQELTAKP